LAVSELRLEARPVRRWAAKAALVAVALPIACLLAVVFAYVIGYRALIVRSGSMTPSIGIADVIVTRVVHPAALNIGDVVTFRDPSRNEELVTHRVRDVVQRVDSFSFVTRGDANTGVERWSVHADGTVGRFLFRIPKVGYVLGWVAVPLVRSALMVGAALFLGTSALRRIWSSGGSPAESNQEAPSTDLDPQDGAGEEARPVPGVGAQRNRGRRLPKQLVDQILTYSMEHPEAGARTIAAAMALPEYGTSTVSPSGIYGVLKRNGLNRRSDRPAAVG
jgi:signal peptidase I